MPALSAPRGEAAPAPPDVSEADVEVALGAMRRVVELRALRRRLLKPDLDGRTVLALVDRALELQRRRP